MQRRWTRRDQRRCIVAQAMGMKVLLSWLREFVPIELDIAGALRAARRWAAWRSTASRSSAPRSRSVVVGEIISTAPHPHAERLTLCEVRTGPGPTRDAWCAARRT